MLEIDIVKKRFILLFNFRNVFFEVQNWMFDFKIVPKKNTLSIKLTLYMILFFWVSSFSQYTNVLISNQNQPSEPSISINPSNTDILLAGANLNNYYVSFDGGLSWSENTLSSSYGVWGDPCTLIGNSGEFYFFHLSNATSWIDRIVCQKSLDNGITFSDGTYFGLNGVKDQDKEWATIDRNNGNIYVFWTEFDTYGSSDVVCKTRILFTKSTDNSQTWSAPVKINQVDGDCVDSDNTVEGAVPAIGPNGEIYTSWGSTNGIVFDKSTDQGVTWLPTDFIIDPLIGGWDFDIPGLDRANGMPVTKCDRSGGAYNGNIYINWSDQSNGVDDTDIWLKKSSDGGNTWSNKIRVNTDSPGKHQFLSWMDIDQTDGTIYIVFYDRRNYSDSQTDVYLAYSTDGGGTFKNVKISDTPFVPSSGAFFGDYTNISAHNGVIRPIWGRLDGGNSSIWTAIIDRNTLSANQELVLEDYKFEIYPNPITSSFYVSFKLKETKEVSLKVYDFFGKKIATCVSKEVYSYGKHTIRVPLKKYKLKNGIYFYTLQIGNKITSEKIIILD